MPFKIVVEHEDGTTLKQIAAAEGVDFSRGLGYYELIKKEKVSAGKNLVLWSNNKVVSEDAVEVLRRCGLRPNADNNIQPSNIPPNHKLFVQSTSSNRKISEDAAVLFVVDDEEEDNEGEELDLPTLKRAKTKTEWTMRMDTIVDLFHKMLNLKENFQSFL
jgi:hypothetical protein